MENSSKEFNKKIIIPFILVLIGFLLPTTGSITSFGWLVIFTFAALIYCNCTRLPAWIVVIVMVFFSIVNNISFMGVIVPAWFGSSSAWLLFSAFWFCAGLRESGLVEIITGWILSRKVAKKGPYWLMFIILLTSFVATGITQSYMAVILFLFEVQKGIVKQLNLEERSGWSLFTALGICMGACMGTMATPWSFMAQTLIAIFKSVGLLVDVNIMLMCGIMILTWAVVTPIYIAICKFILRPKVDAAAFRNFKFDREPLTPAGKKTALGAIIALLVIIVILAIPQFLPSATKAYSIASSLNSTGAFLLAAVILCFFPNPKDPSKKVFTFETDGNDAMDMTMLFSMCASLAIGSYFPQDSVGLSAFLGELISPLYSTLGAVGFICILGLLSCILTNFTINTLAIYIFGTVGAVIFADQPTYAMMMAIVILLGTNMAMALPSASGPALVTHSRHDIIKPSQLIGWGFLVSILATAFICLFSCLFI